MSIIKTLILPKNIIYIDSYSKSFPNLNKVEFGEDFFRKYSNKFDKCF